MYEYALLSISLSGGAQLPPVRCTPNSTAAARRRSSVVPVFVGVENLRALAGAKRITRTATPREAARLWPDRIMLLIWGSWKSMAEAGGSLQKA